MKFLLTTCRNSKNLAKDRWLSLYTGESLIAWNEDTVNSYQFLLGKDRHFSYTIVTKLDSTKIEEYYKGTFEFSNDTIFLKYYKGLKPARVTNHLILEGSRLYLIQPFTDSTKRMFLRFQRIAHTW